jgi:anti-sigma factor RsiW
MLTWNCERVRGELSAFYDEELSVADRIAIADHLDACPSCRLEAEDLMLIGDALQSTARGEETAVMPRLSRLPTDILERWNAEEQASLAQTIKDLFDDSRRTSACIGVSVMASICLATSAFLVAQSPIRHPESLKAALTLNARARTTDIYLPAVSMLPRAYADAIMPATVVNRDNEEVAYAALVTADGNLERIEVIGERMAGRPGAPTNEELLELLNAAATARFEPARAAGAPVSQNVVWLVSHTTVRAPLKAYVHVRVDGWKML